MGAGSSAEGADMQYLALESLHTANCIDTVAAQSWHEQSDSVGKDTFDPRHAVLMFMMAATPQTTVMADIAQRYSEIVDSIDSVFVAQFVGEQHGQVQMLHGVPGTVGPVKVRPAYVQVPEGDGDDARTELYPVWKVCL